MDRYDAPTLRLKTDPEALQRMKDRASDPAIENLIGARALQRLRKAGYIVLPAEVWQANMDSWLVLADDLESRAAFSADSQRMPVDGIDGVAVRFDLDPDWLLKLAKTIRRIYGDGQKAPAGETGQTKRRGR